MPTRDLSKAANLDLAELARLEQGWSQRPETSGGHHEAANAMAQLYPLLGLVDSMGKALQDTGCAYATDCASLYPNTVVRWCGRCRVLAAYRLAKGER